MYDESFRKNPNIEQLAPKLFIYRNFIKGDLLNKINSILKPHINSPKISHNVDWYENRMSGYFNPEGTRDMPTYHLVVFETKVKADHNTRYDC